MTERKQQSNISGRFWSAPRVVATIVVFGMIATFGLASCNSLDSKVVSTKNSKPPSFSTSARTNQPPASAWISLSPTMRDQSLRTVNGGSLRLSDHSDKIIVMNLWATWCGPCRQETPHLVELSKEFKSSGVEIIGLSTESQDPDQEKVKEFMSDYNVQYQMVWDDSGFAPALIQLVNGRGVIPQSFIIARDGRILKHFQGFSPEKTPAALRQAIQEAVNEPPRT